MPDMEEGMGRVLAHVAPIVGLGAITVGAGVLLRGANVNGLVEYWQYGEFPTTFPITEDDAEMMSDDIGLEFDVRRLSRLHCELPLLAWPLAFRGPGGRARVTRLDTIDGGFQAEWGSGCVTACAQKRVRASAERPSSTVWGSRPR